MRKIKVYLQYPWKFPDSPYYKYLVDSPPKGIEYVNVEKQKGVITNKRVLWLSNFLKKSIRFFIEKLKLPVINAHLTKSEKDLDLIHCAHCLSLNKNRPWVADFESLWQLYFGKRTKMAKERIKKIFSDKKCKKVMVWTERIKRDFEEEFPDVKNKIEVVYPAVPLQKIRKTGHKGTNLLFVGRSFYEKGGLDALKAIDYLTKNHKNVEATIVSKTPKEVIKKYSENKKIKFFDLVEKEKLIGIYSQTDIFVYPGYTDTFGFGILECMSFGIPSISVSGFIGRDSKKELINNGANGFLISTPKNFNLGKLKFSFGQLVLLSEAETRENPKIIKELIKKASAMIENKKIRDKMSKNCIETIKNGRFSIMERNKKLKRIYGEALK